MRRRTGSSPTTGMRHEHHFWENISALSGAAIGKMIPLERIRPNPNQSRKELGDLHDLTHSVREKGVLEPLLVRYDAGDDLYTIISGERRFHAAKAAGLMEVPCIEKDADSAEMLELALIENLQRKDLNPFEEAEGLHALAEQFDYTHEEIARRIGKSRATVTESLALRAITPAARRRCEELGLASKPLLVQVARQPNEKKMLALVEKLSQGMSRSEARAVGPLEAQCIDEIANSAEIEALEEKLEYASVTKLRQALLRVVGRLQENPALRYLIFKRDQPQAVLMSFQTYELLKKVMNQVLGRTGETSREEAIQAAFQRLRSERSQPVRASETVAPYQKDALRAIVEALRRDVHRLDDIVEEKEKQAPGAKLGE